MSEIYLLKHPITRTLRIAGGEERKEQTTEVEVRRLTGGDIRWLEAQGGKPGATLGLLARLAGLEASQVDLLDAEDIAAISEVVESFLPPSLRTGETSSGT